MGLLASGRNPAAYKSVDRTNFTATAGQTTFTLSQGYSVGDTEVYLNGVKLLEADDYFATNGLTVVLSSGASVGDSLQVVSYNQFTAANTYTKSEADTRYMVATGQTPMSSYLRTPNYGISSWSDTANASLEASVGAGTSGVGIKAWGRSVPTSGGELTYITDTRGASGQHIWYGYNGTSITQFMKIDTAGRLNIPNQPCFYAYQGLAGTTTSTGTLTFTSTRINVGSGYNTSNGRFTAPVSGNYMFTGHVLHRGNGTAGNLELTFYKNGSNINSRGMAYSVASQTSGHIPVHTTALIPLAAGDYVQLGLYAVSSGSDGYLADNLAHFSGYLIG
jgi:hypothetical protein